MSNVRTMPPGLANIARWVPVTGKAASVNAQDPANWMTYAQAAATGRETAFVFHVSDGLCCIDLDVEEGQAPNEEQNALYEEAKSLGAYVETSRSGRGLHIVGTLHDQSIRDYVTVMNRRGINVEIYPYNHYVIMTGNVVNAGDVNADISEMTLRIFHKYGNAGSRVTEELSNKNMEVLHQMEPEHTDEEVLRRCRSDYGFEAAWNGDGNSENDLIVVNRLTFHSRNNEQIWRLWTNSPMANHRRAHSKNADKLDRRMDYIKGTITRAWDADTLTQDRFRAEAIQANDFEAYLLKAYPVAYASIQAILKAQDQLHMVSPDVSPSHVEGQEPGASVAASPPAPPTGPSFPDALDSRPWFRQIIDLGNPWVHALSEDSVYRAVVDHLGTCGDPRKKLRDATILSSMAYFGPVWGHACLAGSQNASFLGVLIAPTGAGKSLPLDGPKHIIEQVSYAQLDGPDGPYAIHGEVNKLFDDYTVSDAFSEKGVANTVIPDDFDEEAPAWPQYRRNKLFARDEIGLRMNRIVSKDDHGFKDTLLSLTGGQDGRIAGGSRADKKEKVPYIKNVAFTYFGATTPETTVELTSDAMIEAGMVNRLVMTWDKGTYQPEDTGDHTEGLDFLNDDAAILEHDAPERNPMEKEVKDKDLIHRIRAYRVWASANEYQRDDPNDKHNGLSAHYTKEATEMLNDVQYLFDCAKADTSHFTPKQKAAIGRSDTMVEKFALILALGELPVRPANGAIESAGGKYVVDTMHERKFYTKRKQRVPVIFPRHIARAFGIVWHTNQLKLKLIEDNLQRNETRASKEVTAVMDWLDDMRRDAPRGHMFKQPHTKHTKTAPVYALNFGKYGVISKPALVRYLKQSPAFGDAHAPERRVLEVLREFEESGVLQPISADAATGLTMAKRLKGDYYRFTGEENMTALRL